MASNKRIMVEIKTPRGWQEFLGRFQNYDMNLYECLDYFGRKDRYKDRIFRIVDNKRKTSFEGTITELQQIIMRQLNENIL